MKRMGWLVLFLFGLSGAACACSSAVISGRVTLDGRPLLWKNRDTRKMENHARFFTGEKYNFIGVIHTDDVEGNEIWMGSNSAGFSIMNTAAFNLGMGEGYKGPKDQEGFMMKAALERCATLADFETLLEEMAGPRGANSNFGVIDARGGAAYYEVGPETHEKYDVNDPKQAPSGYLIRTNFGFSGTNAKGSAYIRYQTVDDLFFYSVLHDRLTPEFLLIDASRCLKHSLLGHDWRSAEWPDSREQTQYIVMRGYVVRYTSVSAIVIQGVKPGENPDRTTLWTMPGFPLTSLTVPLWVAAGEDLPRCVASTDGAPAPLSTNSLALKEQCFPLHFRDGGDYLDLAVVLNKQGDGILQKILPQEREIIERTNELQDGWNAEGFNRAEARRHYRWLDKTIEDFYKREFGLGEK